MLAIISFINSCWNFTLDFLCLVGSFASSAVGSGVGFHLRVLSNFFLQNSLLLNLLRTFSLELNNNPKLFFKKPFFQLFLPLSKFFILAAKLLSSSSTSSNDRYLSCIFLQKTTGKEYSLKL